MLTPSDQQRDLDTSFYAPDFKIEVDGKALSPETRGDVLDLKVVMELETLTGFEMTVNNWDDGKIDFKYSDGNTFDVGRSVHVQMGYAGRVLSMVHGRIVTLTPHFPETGSPTLGVSGCDSMFLLKGKNPDKGKTKKFVDQTDSEIARTVADRNGLEWQGTDSDVRNPLVLQNDLDEADFLIERARRIDFDCYMQADADTGKEQLFFVRPTDGRGAAAVKVYVFSWGSSKSNRPELLVSKKEDHRLHPLISFSPQLTLAGQMSELTVRGWDSRTKQVFTYTAKPEDLAGNGAKGTSGAAAVKKSMGDKRAVVVDSPVTTQQEAKELAISLLQRRAYEFITGSGRVLGLPDLRPGQNVEIFGLGQRFSGIYYVTKVEHSLTSSGYLTNFDARRTHDGGLKT